MSYELMKNIVLHFQHFRPNKQFLSPFNEKKN